MNESSSTPAPLQFAATALIAAAAIGLLASCAQLPQGTQAERSGDPASEAAASSAAAAPMGPLEPQEDPASPRLWEWSGDGRQVSRIWIDVDTQRARFYAGEDQIGWTTVASGLRSHPTPTGHFEVVEKVSKKRSNLYGKIYNASGKLVNSDAKRGRDPVPAGGHFVGAKMPYFMRLTYDGIGMHAGSIPVPGSPASHGCIRMPGEFAPKAYAHVSIGTPVTVTGDGPHYGNYAERQRLARAAPEPEPEPPSILQASAAEVTPPASADALYRP